MHYDTNARKQLVLDYTMKYNKQVEEFIAVVKQVSKKNGYTVENKIDLESDPIDPKVAGDIELFEDVNIEDKNWAVLAGDTYLVRKQVCSIVCFLVCASLVSFASLIAMSDPCR